MRVSKISWWMMSYYYFCRKHSQSARSQRTLLDIVYVFSLSFLPVGVQQSPTLHQTLPPRWGSSRGLWFVGSFIICPFQQLIWIINFREWNQRGMLLTWERWNWTQGFNGNVYRQRLRYMAQVGGKCRSEFVGDRMLGKGLNLLGPFADTCEHVD